MTCCWSLRGYIQGYATLQGEQRNNIFIYLRSEQWHVCFSSTPFWMGPRRGVERGWAILRSEPHRSAASRHPSKTSLPFPFPLSLSYTGLPPQPSPPCHHMPDNNILHAYDRGITYAFNEYKQSLNEMTKIWL